MSSVNKVILVGRLGKDPETKTLPSGQTVTNFSVATSEKWVDKEGESKEKTEWSNIVAWQKLAEICAKYLTKGSLVYLEGKLQTRSWEDESGQKKYMTEIVATTVQFLDTKKKEDQPQEAEPKSQAASPTSGLPNYAPGASNPPQVDAKEELPF